MTEAMTCIYVLENKIYLKNLLHTFKCTVIMSCIMVTNHETILHFLHLLLY